jgi:DNA-binding GntR family transcriptional regulator
MADLQWRAMFSAGLDEATSGEMHVFAREAVAFSLKPNVSDFFPALAAADLQSVRRVFTRHLARVYQLIDQQIDQRSHDRGGGPRKDDLLDVMLDMEEQGKDDVDLDDSLVNVNRDFIRAFLTVSMRMHITKHFLHSMFKFSVCFNSPVNLLNL